jgi:carboxymethylenebutenolidase
MNDRALAEQALDVETADGRADSLLVRPAGSGRWPAVLFLMDGLGIRPELKAMARRLAQAGYVVLQPNLYYRAGRAETLGITFERAMVLIEGLTNAMVMRDAAAYIELLTAHPAVKSSRIGCMGYCMGGGLTLATAAHFPQQVAAAASIHGARVATDRPDSPHRLAAQIRARTYVAVAEQDPWLEPGETDRLAAALQSGGVDHEIEVYPGVQHGFAVPGLPIYDEPAAEHHWEKVLELLARTL